MADESQIVEPDTQAALTPKAWGGIAGLLVLLISGGGLGADALLDKRTERMDQLEIRMSRQLNAMAAMAVVIETRGVCQKALVRARLQTGAYLRSGDTTGISVTLEDMLDNVDACLGNPEMDVERFERIWTGAGESNDP